MLHENYSIISESEAVAKIFNKYFNEIAEGITGIQRTYPGKLW